MAGYVSICDVIRIRRAPVPAGKKGDDAPWLSLEVP
jgi:hypothetical protein